MPFINEIDDQNRWQTIDRENGIILKECKQHPEFGNHFELYFSGEIIEFYAWSRDKVHGIPVVGARNKYDVKWEIYKIFIPQTLQKEIVLDIIHQALVARGYMCMEGKANSVSVTFNTSEL